MNIVQTTNNHNYKYGIRVPVDGRIILLYILQKFNAVSGLWHIDIFDRENTLLVAGVPLVGRCNLLEQFAYLGIGAAFVLPPSEAYTSEESPGKDSLPEWLFCWGDTI